MFKNITKLNTFLSFVTLAVLSIAMSGGSAYAQTTVGTLGYPVDTSQNYNSGGSYGYGQVQQNNNYYPPTYVQPQTTSPAPASTGTVYSNTSNSGGTGSTKAVTKVTSKTDASLAKA